VDMPTGFEPDLESRQSDISFTKKTEIKVQKTIILYYDEVCSSEQ